MNMHLNWQERGSRRYHPHYPRFEQIPHYYGDVVRMLFLFATVVMLGGAPFYADALTQQLPYLIIGGVIVVALAALTNPWSTLLMRFNAVVSGVGAVVFEYWALWHYYDNSPVEFVLRQAVALIFMFTFYFALKTLRAMLMDMIGKEGDLTEFAGEEKLAEEEMKSFAQETQPEDGLGHIPAEEDDTGND